MKIELLSKDKLTFFAIDVIQEVDRVFDNTITDIAIIPVYNLKKTPTFITLTSICRMGLENGDNEVIKGCRGRASET